MADDFLIDVITHEKQLPALLLVNTFGADEERSQKFCTTLDQIRSDYQIRLETVLDHKGLHGLDNFFQLDNLQPDVHELDDLERYFSESTFSTLQPILETANDYNRVVVAQKNLTECMKQTKICLEIAQSFKKIEELAQQKNFYLAAVTLEQLRAKMASNHLKKYKFVAKMAEALEKLSHGIFEDALDSLSKFLQVLSEQFINVGEDVVANNWECNPDKFIDYSYLASFCFITKLLKKDDFFFEYYSQQLDLLLRHIFTRYNSTTKLSPQSTLTQLVYTLIGFFISQVRASDIFVPLSDLIQSLWTDATLWLQDRVHEVLIQSQTIDEDRDLEKIIQLVLELIKVAQYYSLQISVLESTIEVCLKRFCHHSIEKDFDEKFSALKTDTNEEESKSNELAEIKLSDNLKLFAQLGNPKFSSKDLSQAMLNEYWVKNKKIVFNKLVENLGQKILDMKIAKSNKPFEEISKMWKTLPDSFKEVPQNLAFFDSESTILKIEALIVVKIKKIVEDKVKQTFHQMENQDDFGALISNSSLVDDLFKWIEHEVEFIQNETKFLESALNAFVSFVWTFFKTNFPKRTKTTIEQLEKIKHILEDTVRLGKNLKISDLGSEICIMTSLLESIMTSDDAITCRSLFMQLYGDAYSTTYLSGYLKKLRQSSEVNKTYAKSAKGKAQLKKMAMLCKKTGQFEMNYWRFFLQTKYCF